MPLLDIRNLTIEFKTGDEWVKAVDRVELHNEEQLYIASATATYMVG